MDFAQSISTAAAGGCWILPALSFSCLYLPHGGASFCSSTNRLLLPLSSAIFIVRRARCTSFYLYIPRYIFQRALFIFCCTRSCNFSRSFGTSLFLEVHSEIFCTSFCMYIFSFFLKLYMEKTFKTGRSFVQVYLQNNIFYIYKSLLNIKTLQMAVRLH